MSKGQIDDIKRIRSQFVKYREEQVKNLHGAEREHEKAAQECEIGKRSYNNAEMNFERLKNYQKVIEAKFSEINNIKAQIGKESNPKNIYFLNEDINGLLREIRLKPLEKFTKELDEALKAVNLARDNLADKSARVERSRARTENLRNELDLLDRDRRDKIISRLE